MFVVRRKHPRHDGSRYFNDRGPCARECADGAAYGTPAEAEAARKGLREPHLWEAMPATEAAALDKGETEAFAARLAAVPERSRARFLFALGAASGHGVKS